METKTNSKTYPNFEIDKPRYDQGTYLGRVRHFMDIIDPRTLLTSDAKLKESLQLIEKYRKGILPPNVTEEQLWQAKKIRDAIIHPDTGEKIFLPFRMSCFVPLNIPIVMGMLQSTSVAGNLFWQWFNQSLNVAVNYSNRNATISMPTDQIVKSYSVAVFTSCSIAFALNGFLKRSASFSPIPRTLAKITVPYSALAVAGALNVYLMRRKEILDGIQVKDREGRVMGVSQEAGKIAIAQVIATRLFLPLPVLVAPPFIMMGLERFSKTIRSNPRIRGLTEVSCIMLSLLTALPASIGLFPQTSSVPAERLERRFHNLIHNNKRIDVLYFNKGL